MSLVQRLDDAAAAHPHKSAIEAARSRLTFGELSAMSQEYARAFADDGFEGRRVLMLMRPSPAWVAVVFGLFRAGAIPVFVDPGLRRDYFFDCIAKSEPELAIAEPLVLALRLLKPDLFRSIRRVLVSSPVPLPFAARLARKAPALRGMTEPGERVGLIAFTSGSTGSPKGVEMLHRHLDAQLEIFRDTFRLTPDDVHLVTLPPLAIWFAAMGQTSALAPMDFSRPASVDPAKFVEAARVHGATSCFGSPALWDRVSRHCRQRGITMPSLRKVITAGAPVRPELLKRCANALPNAVLHVPYGATEAMVMTSLTATDALGEAAAERALGKGTCMGRPVRGVEIAILRPTPGPIAALTDDLRLPAREVGEVVVRGPLVAESYLGPRRLTEESKIPAEGGGVWHRTGDAGYLDAQGRLWLGGRLRHEIRHAGRSFHPVMVEGIFDAIGGMGNRCLVAVGEAERQKLGLVVEQNEALAPREELSRQIFALARGFSVPLQLIALHPGPLPVDRRHNAKLDREAIHAWADANRSLWIETQVAAKATNGAQSVS